MRVRFDDVGVRDGLIIKVYDSDNFNLLEAGIDGDIQPCTASQIVELGPPFTVPVF